MEYQQKVKRKFLFANAIQKEKTKQNISRIIISFFVISLIVMIIIQPNICISSVYNGLSVWAKTILPSLFPFVFLTQILTKLNTLDGLSKRLSKITKFLFKAPAISGYIFLMSIVSGYPVGAKLISEFYGSGKITQKQANKLVSFCSTSGPLFIIGSVGVGIFLNKKIGYILFASHIFSSIINGIIYRNKFADQTEKEIDKDNQTNLTQILPETMQSTVLSCLIVGGYIAIFFMIIDIINNFGIFSPLISAINHIFPNINQVEIKSTIFGFIEMSKGCIEIAKTNISLVAKATITSFLISFGGLCTFFQATTFLSKCKVNLKFYLFQKFTHALISAILTFLLATIVL